MAKSGNRGTAMVARAMRDLGLRAAQHKTFPNLSGIVRKLKPLTVEIHHADLILEGDEVILSNHVRQYDFKYGIDVGDTLLFTANPQGDYHAVSVITKVTSLAGLKHPFQPGGGDLTDVPIVGRVPYYDDDGNHIGDVPLI